MRKIAFVLCSLPLLLAGCGQSSSCVPGEQTMLPAELYSISESQSALKTLVLLGDEPSEKVYLDIEQKMINGEAVRMDIYSLESDVTSEDLIATRPSDNIIQRRARLIAKDGSIVHQWNQNSLFEQVFNEDKHHRTDGVEPSAMKEDSFYLYTAKSFVDNQLKPKTTGHYEYFPYKQKRVILHEEKTDQPDYHKETVSQVGVAFSSKLDGWPIIGPGGKIYVHMLPDGEIVSYSHFYKIPNRSIARLTEKDLKTPQEALSELAKDNEVELDKIEIIRKEFGYYYRGKDSIQNIIAPYYAFFYKYKNSPFDTKVLKLVSAVKGQYASIVDEDAAVERARKDAQVNGISSKGE